MENQINMPEYVKNKPNRIIFQLKYQHFVYCKVILNLNIIRKNNARKEKVRVL